MKFATQLGEAMTGGWSHDLDEQRLIRRRAIAKGFDDDPAICSRPPQPRIEINNPDLSKVFITGIAAGTICFFLWINSQQKQTTPTADPAGSVKYQLKITNREGVEVWPK